MNQNTKGALRTWGMLSCGALLFALQACKVIQEDHCLHQAENSNLWCAEQYPGLPFCSPCEAVSQGCVATAPTPIDCPAYSDPGSGSGSDADSGSASDDAADPSPRLKL